MIKTYVQKIFNKAGYKIESTDNFYRSDNFFKVLLNKVKKYTMTNNKRIYFLYNSIIHIWKCLQ